MPDNATEPVPAPAASDRLDSWKEIAAYLKREVRTVQLWEKREGLPVHRHVHSGRPSVYAYQAELDAWWNNRRPKLEQQEEITAAQRRRWRRIAAVAGGVAALAVFWFSARRVLQPGQANPRATFEPGAVLSLPNAGYPAVGDFNNDGILDIVASFNTGAYRAHSSHFAVFLGLGGGKFAEPVIYEPGHHCGTMQTPGVADLNNDGALDLILLAGYSSDLCFGNKFTVHLGNGRGGFRTPPREFTTGGAPSSLAIGDFNEDGNQDVAIFCRDDMKVYVYLGAGSGDFVAGPTLSLGGKAGPGSPGELHYTLLNEDQHGDFLVSLYHMDVVKGFLGTGKGEFLTSPNELAVRTPLAIASANLNGDGFSDYVVVSNLPGKVILLVGGEGGFGANQRTVEVDEPAATMWEGLTDAVAEDFDGDGQGDIAVFSAADRSVWMLLGNGQGGISHAQNVPLGNVNPKDLVSADLDGDGLKDLVAASESPPGLLIVWNRTRRPDSAKEKR
ncbi:MAG: FG-GAP-like repeat-containing protein [Candidatus Acidiferrales bacterium]